VQCPDPLTAIPGADTPGQHRESRADRVLVSWVLGGPSGFALLVAMMGLYAALSYSVRVRTRDLAVRVALGAGHRQVLAHVMRPGVGIVGAGLAAGLAASLFLHRLLSGLVAGFHPADPLTIRVVTLLLVSIASLALFMPARLATRIDPAKLLRRD